MMLMAILSFCLTTMLALAGEGPATSHVEEQQQALPLILHLPQV
jgi:hypothetical protein